jgi:transposase-like protein
MMRSIPPEVRAAIVADLREREAFKAAVRERWKFSLKAIGRKHNVSRQTLTRLRRRLLRELVLSQHGPR